jgi:hypothetical protein
MNNRITAPIVALMMEAIIPPPIMTPSAPSTQLPMNAPTMPTMMLPMSPNPTPLTDDASEPAGDRADDDEDDQCLQ